jgi:hypothetical protein
MKMTVQVFGRNKEKRENGFPPKTEKFKILCAPCETFATIGK